MTKMNQRKRVERLRRERDLLRHINKEMAGEVTKLRAALERIGASTCCDKGQEVAWVAREALEVTSTATVRKEGPFRALVFLTLNWPRRWFVSDPAMAAGHDAPRRLRRSTQRKLRAVSPTGYQARSTDSL